MTDCNIVWILNLSPDSFSDGRSYSLQQLNNRIQELIADGADLIDVWAESTAPWSKPVDEQVERQRLQNFLLLIKKYQIAFSLDTTKASIAKEAIEVWVSMINDVSWGRQDATMFSLIAETGVKYVLMYSKNPSGRADLKSHIYANIIDTVINYFHQRLIIATKAWIKHNQLILDPWMGAFVSSNSQDSIALLQAIPQIKAEFHLPIYIGTSRKWFLSELAKDHWPQDRLGSSLASSLYATTRWANYIRVHDIHYTRQCLDTRKALER